ncbi:MAG: TIGR00730 family Rossman fold protein [Bacteroidales bacterium]|nr:TIGR00730 family Rossman fold protein [Bacteroidales bacterium]
MFRNLGIFCGASLGDDSRFEKQTKELIKLLAQKNIRIIYGGGNTGLMGVVAESALKHHIPILGVVPSFMLSMGVVHQNIDLHVVENMQERKKFILDNADAFVVLPGGIGTMDEFFEVLTAVQLGTHLKPIGLFNINHFFDPLLRLLHHLTDHRFVRLEHVSVVTDDDPERLLEYLKTPIHQPDKQWICDLLKYNML